MRSRLGIFFLVLFLLSSGISCAKRLERHRVRWVIDGDTIVLENHQKVRYAGINAPEIPHEDEPGEPFGKEALRANIKLVKGKMVIIEPAEEPRDRFGRLLAYVFLPNGDLVQERLVSLGLAFVCYLPPNLKYYQRLLETQRKAISESRGLWGAENFLRGESYYIGNRRSRKFHRPGCPFGQRTSRTNRIIFKDMKEAFRQGYCPCRKCRPWPGRGK